ncbi:hypothetical protein ACEPAG_9644 [Sanghuangporus baumii]
MMDAYDPRTHPPPHVQYDQHSYASSYYTPGLQSSASASSSAYPSPAYPSYDYASQSPYSGSNSGFNSVESRTLGYNLPAQSTESSLGGSFVAGEGGHSAASSVRSSPDAGPSLDYPSNSASTFANQQLRPPMHSQSRSPNASASSSASSSPRPSQPLKSTSLSNGSPSQVTFNGTPLSRPLTHKEQEMLAHLDRLKFFLATAPSRWATADGDGLNESDGSFGNGTMSSGRMQQGTPMMPHPNTHPALNRFLLPSGEYVTCVLWSGLYHITGTDIVRALVFRFEAFGRPVRNMKKFEEGVFSDLRNLKPGSDACLEEPKSPFLDLLFKYQCIRTQKKQKVFYWFSVPHDRLFLDALERDLKREKMGLEPTTVVVGEPALSFTYDSKRSLYEQFSKAQGIQEGEGELESVVRRAEEAMAMEQESEARRLAAAPSTGSERDVAPSTIFNMFSLFEGSPNYKQRRKKGPRTGRSGLGRDSASEEERETHSGVGSTDVVDDVDGELSAAAMFDAQAGLGGGAGHQARAQRQAESQRAIQAQRLAMIHRTSAIPKARQLPGRGMHPSMIGSQLHSNSLPANLDSVRKTKAYVCPLYSCQRLFKRFEHLKRHVRMHTMERPHQCEMCQRRFSRADNLSQHMRIHSRDATNMSNAVPVGDADGDEGVDQVMYAPGEQYDLNACEIEVADHPSTRFEDDDYANAYGAHSGANGPAYNGLVGSDTPQFANLVTSPENSPRLTDAQSNWAAAHGHSNSLPAGYDYVSSHPSPAFSTVSAPSSRYTTAYGNSNYPVQNDVASSYAPSSAGSLSAPAHKQTFDHAVLYPPSLGNVQGFSPSAVGPIRRYRSVTPTIARTGEQIRRPLTANTLDASPLGPGAAASRGYHPYSVPQYSSASQHSSPAAYQAQLDYSQQTPGTQTNSPAGSTVYQDDLQTLIGLDVATLGSYENSSMTAAAAASGVAAYAGDVYSEATAAQGQFNSTTADSAAAAATANYYADMNNLSGTAQYSEQSYSYAS